MAARHFGFSLREREKHGTDIMERNAGDLVNESSRGSHTFTCPALFFPTFVSSMREDLRVAALCFHLHAFGFRERLWTRRVRDEERWWRDQIDSEKTFIPKTSLPIRFARRTTLGGFFEYRQIEKGRWMSSFDRRNDCDGSSRDEEAFRSVNSFPTIIGDPVRSLNYYSTILRTILGEFNIWSRQPLRVCVSRSTRFVSRNYTGFVVSNSTVFSKYIFSKCQYYAPRQRCFSTIKSTCTYRVRVICVHQWPKQMFHPPTKIKRFAQKFARNSSRKRSANAKTLALFAVTIFHGRFRVNSDF